MSPRDQLQVIAEAIRNAERCPEYDADGEQCEGLDGCAVCLQLAAEAVLIDLEEAS